MRRPTIVDEFFNQVVWYGGLPMRLGDVVKDMDAVAKTWDAKNWMRIRDAGLMGLFQFNKDHPVSPEVAPISYEEFYNRIRKPEMELAK